MCRAAVVLFTLLFLLVPAAGAEDLAAPIRLTFIGLNDFHGALEARHAKVVGGREVGGIDIIAAYVQALRKANPGGVLLMDAGDLYQGTLLSAASEGKAVIEFYNEIGFDASAVGNHDFDFGPEGYHCVPSSPDEDSLGVIKKRIRESRFPFLAANIFDRQTGKPVQWDNLEPYAIVVRKGVKIGVVGLTSVDTPLTTHPANVRQLEFRPLLVSLRRVLPALRAAGASVVIVLVHAGVGVDEESGEAIGPVADLARALEPGEVDLILSGHWHMPFAGRVQGIPVMQTWASGVSFARADLEVDPLTKRVIEDRTVLHDSTFFFRSARNGRSLLFAGQVIKPLPQFVRRLRQYRRSIAHLQRIRLGQAAADLAHHTELDSPVGNLVTDAMRDADQSIDVAMYNSGGLRTSIPKGVITFGRIYEVVPFDNSLVKVMLTGVQIREILEHGLAGPYGVMEISGLVVVFDPDRQPGQRCISIVCSDGKELEDDRLYTVGTNEFVLNGGDGYYTFARGRNVHNTHTLIRELVARYIKKQGIVGPAEGGRYRPKRTARGKKTAH
ncbi:MAG: 5'-nucleotidase C-terminal domain-containing protein [Deltaproteobacteria bacterium]|nr:5'-nucleotidase C-terminal domain-containing protein [Deltaproteobacteria bacterium]